MDDSESDSESGSSMKFIDHDGIAEVRKWHCGSANFQMNVLKMTEVCHSKASHYYSSSTTRANLHNTFHVDQHHVDVHLCSVKHPLRMSASVCDIQWSWQLRSSTIVCNTSLLLLKLECPLLVAPHPKFRNQECPQPRSQGCSEQRACAFPKRLDSTLVRQLQHFQHKSFTPLQDDRSNMTYIHHASREMRNPDEWESSLHPQGTQCVLGSRPAFAVSLEC